MLNANLKQPCLRYMLGLGISSCRFVSHDDVNEHTQIAKFMGPTWGPPGSCRPQMGPMLAPWTLPSGYIYQAPLFPWQGVTWAQQTSRCMTQTLWSLTSTTPRQTWCATAPSLIKSAFIFCAKQHDICVALWNERHIIKYMFNREWLVCVDWGLMMHICVSKLGYHWFK